MQAGPAARLAEALAKRMLATRVLTAASPVPKCGPQMSAATVNMSFGWPGRLM